MRTRRRFSSDHFDSLLTVLIDYANAFERLINSVHDKLGIEDKDAMRDAIAAELRNIDNYPSFDSIGIFREEKRFMELNAERLRRNKEAVRRHREKTGKLVTRKELLASTSYQSETGFSSQDYANMVDTADSLEMREPYHKSGYTKRDYEKILKEHKELIEKQNAAALAANPSARIVDIESLGDAGDCLDI